jgi:hypothetical protein
MSDIITDPIEHLYTETLTLIKRQVELKEWISVMRDAGENVAELEVKWKNNEAKIRQWKTALVARGKVFN